MKLDKLGFDAIKFFVKYIEAFALLLLIILFAIIQLTDSSIFWVIINTEHILGFNVTVIVVLTFLIYTKMNSGLESTSRMIEVIKKNLKKDYPNLGVASIK